MTDTTTRINVKLLVDTLSYIEMHPDTWDQTSWRAVPYDDEADDYVLVDNQRCGAKLCFAGHVAAISGGKWLLEPKHLKSIIAAGDDPNDYSGLAALKPLKGEMPSEEYLMPNGSTKPGVDANERAQSLLGLTDDEATRLFDADNDIWRLRRIVGEYVLAACTEAGR